MGDRVLLSELAAAIVPGLVSYRDWGDASFISLPLIYPSGSFVTVRLTYRAGGVIRVSDSGFAFREAESFGATRSFPRVARSVAADFDVEVDRRSLYVDVDNPQEVERAIFDVSAASRDTAERIVSRSANDVEAAIADALHVKLDQIFPSAVEHEGRIIGASSTEWEVTAIAKYKGHSAIFQAVTNYPVAIFKASTAFHDLAALDNPPTLVSVVANKEEMGKNYSILAQAGRVIEIGQTNDAFVSAAA
ncbi:hypothetical protein [Martelella sp. AD-3]|uniref:hypothetical protein n=1 Tax=Martelella sp. AD-3 TaxID=686597 RepID=UPI000465C33E|nr:hypothetical protein [Martelella sp. AD-3]AMM83154.1 hypothetical protein AZF01_01240 [Martelella sp. AD-3]